MEFQFEKGILTYQTKNERPARLSFVTPKILRYQVDPTGEFSEQPTIMIEAEIPTEGDATVATGGKGQVYKEPILTGNFPALRESGWAVDQQVLQTAEATVTWNELNQQWEINHQDQTIIVKEPGFDEGKSFTLGIYGTQNEFYFGGGTQNGHYSLKGKKVAIENQNRWTNGGVASPVPFYLSSLNYGVLFNTFTKGSYDFSNPGRVALSHEDHKVDCFIILGEDIAGVIKGYQELTGKPQLNPLYSYYPAHLNAYNRDYWVEVTQDSDGSSQFPDGKWYKEYQPLNPKTFNLKKPGKIKIGDLELVPNVYGEGKVTFIDPDPNGLPQKAVRESLNGETNNQQFSARAIIERYQTYDLPLGWMLPNDGYGAGYGQTETLDGDVDNLREFVDYAEAQGVETGLWTQENLSPENPEAPKKDERDLTKEVGIAGVAALKTDVAWVGAGYTFGLNGIAKAFDTMKANSNKRPFIVTLDGWAGTQRYGSIWSGDQTGSDWENIRFHIPTYLSTGLSGNPNVGADIDGIFGGDDPVILTRDLQWKSFTPMQLLMDGWGSRPKDLGIQFGEPYLSINRFYLKLKTRILPYFYSLAQTARETGLPILRPTFMAEASNYTYGDTLNDQFLLGDSLLVAPIYEAYQLAENGDDVRAHLYLPKNQAGWYDFFSGEHYAGGQTLSEFQAPFWKLPLFVKAGSIIPMVNASNQPREIDFTQQELVVYPGAEASLVLYEDDGISNEFEQGNYLTQAITLGQTDKQISLQIAAATGKFVAQRPECQWKLSIYSPEKPQTVSVNGEAVAFTHEARQMMINEEVTVDQGRFVEFVIPKTSRTATITMTIEY